MAQSEQRRGIPTSLSLEQFDEFVCPLLTEGQRGPKPAVSAYAVFNYILQVLHMGCSWKKLPIAKGEDGEPEIHYSRIYRTFRGSVAVRQWRRARTATADRDQKARL